MYTRKKLITLFISEDIVEDIWFNNSVLVLFNAEWLKSDVNKVNRVIVIKTIGNTFNNTLKLIEFLLDTEILFSIFEV